jgi:hypothetical protein
MIFEITFGMRFAVRQTNINLITTIKQQTLKQEQSDQATST